MGRDSLGGFEFEVLSALLLQPQNAYGISIRDKITERTGRAPGIGAVYTTLERLEQKGFVSSWWGESTAERGGRRKRLYKIEAIGQDAIRRTADRMSQWQMPGVMLPAGT